MVVYGYTSSFNYAYHYYVNHGLFHQESELTWQAICRAWVTNDFEGKEWTIAIIDHMRKLMWDKPFQIRWATKPEAEST